MAADQPFDLILMDCRMPVMDGLEATRRIRAVEHGRRTPIVALTANSTDDEIAECTRAGMDGFIAKPINLTGFRNTLSRWLAAPGSEPSQRPD